MQQHIRPGSLSAISVIATVLLAGCASSPGNLAVANQPPNPCPSDLTPACYEYIGKKMRCYCSSRDGLRDILEPTEPH